MSKNTIERIKEAEANAQAMIAVAEEQAKQIIAEARANGEQLLATTREETTNENNEKMKKLGDKVKALVIEQGGDARDEVEDLKEHAGRRQIRAEKVIIGRLKELCQ